MSQIRIDIEILALQKLSIVWFFNIWKMLELHNVPKLRGIPFAWLHNWLTKSIIFVWLTNGNRFNSWMNRKWYNIKELYNNKLLTSLIDTLLNFWMRSTLERKKIISNENFVLKLLPNCGWLDVRLDNNWKVLIQN